MYVHAEELESKIKDIIVKERTSDDFIRDVRELVQERDTFRERAEDAVDSAERTLARSIAEVAKAVGAAAGAGGEGDDDATAERSEQLGAAKKRQRTAEAEMETAKQFAQSKERAWERLEAIIHESRILAGLGRSRGLKRKPQNGVGAAAQRAELAVLL